MGEEMPSESIYTKDGIDVRVAWGSNQSCQVQVATLAASREHVGEETARVIAIVNEWLKDADMPLVDLAKLRAKLPYTPSFDGWHASLDDWAGINRLIKVLKRARDQAFGTPE
jgi:hypothetical protein